MRFAWMLLIPLMIGVAEPAAAQRQPMPQARVTMDAARRTAMQRVPNSTEMKGELKYKDGKPVYEFDLMSAGKSGHQQVTVDAVTGSVMQVDQKSGNPMQGGQPRVSMAAARKTAMQRVPNSAVIREEFEHKHGKPVYTFNLQTMGKTGYDEVSVDANTGSILKVEHEASSH